MLYTTGFELRFEKPLARYFSLGGLLSNYFIRPESGYEYALDIAPYIKPRVPFRIGKQEGEVYVVVQDPLRKFTLGQLTFQPGFAFRF